MWKGLDMGEMTMWLSTKKDRVVAEMIEMTEIQRDNAVARMTVLTTKGKATRASMMVQHQTVNAEDVDEGVTGIETEVQRATGKPTRMIVIAVAVASIMALFHRPIAGLLATMALLTKPKTSLHDSTKTAEKWRNVAKIPLPTRSKTC